MVQMTLSAMTNPALVAMTWARRATVRGAYRVLLRILIAGTALGRERSLSCSLWPRRQNRLSEAGNSLELQGRRSETEMGKVTKQTARAEGRPPS